MFIPIENRLGIQPFGTSSAIQNMDLGTIIRARDAIYGEGEFIYLVGVIGTAVGSVVIWDGQSNGNPTYQTALAPAAQFLGQPLAVSMSANGAGQYGWYQIGGQAVCATNGTVSPTLPAYLAGNGQVTTTVATGSQILNAVSITISGTPSSGLAVVEIDRPFAEGESGNAALVVQRSITTSANLPIRSSDVTLNINAVSDLIPVVPLAAGRSGLRLTFKALPASHSQTLTATSPDTFDGATPITLTAGASITLIPYNDGVNSGYAIE